MANTTEHPIDPVHSSPIPYQTPVPQNWFRGVIQGKTRILLAWIVAGLLGLSAKSAPALPGIVICFLGATLRFWASGYLRKDRRPAVGGPYGYVRNPLYLGTYIMALGVTASTQNWFFLGALSVFFAILYHYIILDEEIKLRQIFGPPYFLYLESVPRFFMRPWPASKKTLLQINPESFHQKFSWDVAKKNKALEAYYSFLGLIAWVWVSSFIWQKIV